MLTCLEEFAKRQAIRQIEELSYGGFAEIIKFLEARLGIHPIQISLTSVM